MKQIWQNREARFEPTGCGAEDRNASLVGSAADPGDAVATCRRFSAAGLSKAGPELRKCVLLMRWLEHEGTQAVGSKE